VKARRDLSSARRRGSDLTTYIATGVAGLIVGICAWGMSRQSGSVAPTVQFTPAAASSAPTAVRPGQPLVP
jgi:hypothetical protein